MATTVDVLCPSVVKDTLSPNILSPSDSLAHAL